MPEDVCLNHLGNIADMVNKQHVKGLFYVQKGIALSNLPITKTPVMFCKNKMDL